MYHSSRWAPRARAATLWTAVTAAALALARLAATTIPGALGPAPEPAFADLLVAGSAAAAALATGWLWVITTAVAVDVLRAGAGAGAAAAVGPVRRALLAACGVAVLVAAQPAAADTGPDAPAPAGSRGGHPLTGLPLPDRATGGDGSRIEERDRSRAAPHLTATVRVRPGDSLWAIARSALGPDATTAEVAAHWPRLYRANRRVIGDDPDLIHPGQRLDVPPRPTPPGGTS
ncbi:hypothetical protein HNR19_001170 [Nocardioides thalensis]|uniref:LysM domain-containing protein n=1 Tax=Nocardioides thalensis TaxID=1914755 RepID=A0A853C171_9ACTN|nr:LysM domain-containing protein [Nocardioides thalensis]NYJ00472.1 hypothetical protein [Nocardioides thalensis]